MAKAGPKTLAKVTKVETTYTTRPTQDGSKTTSVTKVTKTEKVAKVPKPSPAPKSVAQPTFYSDRFERRYPTMSFLHE